MCVCVCVVCVCVCVSVCVKYAIISQNYPIFYQNWFIHLKQTFFIIIMTYLYYCTVIAVLFLGFLFLDFHAYMLFELILSTTPCSGED